MEDQRDLPQQPLSDPTHQKDTDFGAVAFDSTPIRNGRFGGINEWIFSMMRPKRKPERTHAQEPLHEKYQSDMNYQSPPGTLQVHPNDPRAIIIPPDYNIQNGLLMQKKTLAEIVRDQLKYPDLTKAPAAISGAALLVFAVGAYLIYAELPTHPDIVVGILLVTVAGNIIVSRR